MKIFNSVLVCVDHVQVIYYVMNITQYSSDSFQVISVKCLLFTIKNFNF